VAIVKLQVEWYRGYDYYPSQEIEAGFLCEEGASADLLASLHLHLTDIE